MILRRRASVLFLALFWCTGRCVAQEASPAATAGAASGAPAVAKAPAPAPPGPATDPAKSVSGSVVDPRGVPVVAARVVLVSDKNIARLFELTLLNETFSDKEGAFALRPPRGDENVLVASAPGFAPVVVRLTKETIGQPQRLVLGEAAHATFLMPKRVRREDQLLIVDGAGVGRLVDVRGGRKVTVGDLAAGPGRARLLHGKPRTIELAAGETVGIQLESGASVYGQVTQAGVAVEDATVAAIRVDDHGHPLKEAETTTDRDGKDRLDGLVDGWWSITAATGDGRGEASLTLAGSLEQKVDLEIHVVALAVLALDPEEHAPLSDVTVRLAPADQSGSCLPGAAPLTADTLVADVEAPQACGRAQGRTGADGRVRLLAPRTGAYALYAYAEGRRPFAGTLYLGEGEASLSIGLAAGAARKIKVEIVTDPPGQRGVLYCVSGGQVFAVPDVVGAGECPELPAGPAQIIFRAPGSAIGLTLADVPEQGDVDVTVIASRGGRITMPQCYPGQPLPDYFDEHGISWSALLAQIGALLYERREWAFGASWPWPGGHYWTWVLPEAPPGRYYPVWKDRPPDDFRFIDTILPGMRVSFGCGPEVNSWRGVEQ